jgi:AmmeMemoRadiSam system protein A
MDESSLVRPYPKAYEKEHSLEVQLPFLQTVFKDVAIVPILIGQPTRESFASLTTRLSTVLRKHENAIIIASSDLSHYHDYSLAQTMDSTGLDAIARMSVEDLQQRLASGESEMCGGYPVLLTMAVARQLGATHGVLYRKANSGDVTGDRSRVVGYAALGLYKSPLTSAERKELLALAKRTIDTYVRRGSAPEYTTRDARLLANGAVFVTISKNHELRGCIGHIQAMMPLYRSVISNAVSASSRDPRFPPMTRDELANLAIEVTVLSPLEALDDVKDIRIGTHGLYITQGDHSGVLLPQVAEEYHWDVPTFLEQVSIKAGLPGNAWKDAQLYTFTADIIK